MSNAMLERSERTVREQTDFLLDGNMEGKPLSICLDSSRWGGQTTVLYEMSVVDLVSFVENWMRQNGENSRNLFLEKEDLKYYRNTKLPYVHHKTCPSGEKHTGMIKDLNGAIRCAHTKEEKMKPNFVNYFDSTDIYSQMRRRKYFEMKPRDPVPDDAYDFKTGKLNSFWKKEEEDYEKELKKFEKEEETFVVKDTCFAILSDKGTTLPLETVVRRLNLAPEYATVYCQHYKCPEQRLSQMDKEETNLWNGVCKGHMVPTGETVFDFDGYHLASVVKKWFNQSVAGTAPLYKEHVSSLPLYKPRTFRIS